MTSLNLDAMEEKKPITRQNCYESVCLWDNEDHLKDGLAKQSKIFSRNFESGQMNMKHSSGKLRNLGNAPNLQFKDPFPNQSAAVK